jgi:hypothetical protein
MLGTVLLQMSTRTWRQICLAMADVEIAIAKGRPIKGSMSLLHYSAIERYLMDCAAAVA